MKTRLRKILKTKTAILIISLVLLESIWSLPIDAATVGAKRVDTFTSSGTWTAPANVTSVTVEAWGAGGGGTTNTAAGGGGAYSRSTISVTPGNNYDVVVGTSAGNTNGGDSTFDSTAVVAKGGLSGGNGGTGGAAGSGTGTTKFSGGNGASGTGNRGAGGGAGDSGNGGDAAGAVAGDPGEVNGGFNQGASPGRIYGGGGPSTSGAGFAGARGEVRLTYLIESPTGYPVVMERSYNRSAPTDTTSHSITMPAGIQVGDLLIIIFSSDGAPTASISSGNWTKLGQDSQVGNVTQAIFYKYAEGSDTATVSTDASEQSSHIIYRISNATSVPTVTFANGNSTNADSPSHSPGTSAKYLWIASASWDGGGSVVDITSAPSNYRSLIIQPESKGANGAKTATSERLNEASSEDPGAFTSDTEQWVASTISVEGKFAADSAPGPVRDAFKTIIKAMSIFKAGTIFK